MARSPGDYAGSAPLPVGKKPVIAEPGGTAAKRGTALARARLSSLISRSERVMEASGAAEHAAVLTFGSAGGRHLVNNSDTDFTLLHDGTLHPAALLDLQARLTAEFDHKPWKATFKAWDRVNANPMDLLALRFICGNRQLFLDHVVQNETVSKTMERELLVSTLTGNDLHLEFMASRYFSGLLDTYHTTREMPVGICRGDVKYFTGGTRWAQDITMIAMLYARQRFLADVDLNVLALEGVLDAADLARFEESLGFLLSVKDLCVQGSNILRQPNSVRIAAELGGQPEDLAAQYDLHTSRVRQLSRQAHRALIRDFASSEGASARSATSPETLFALVDAGKPELWRTICLRRDVPVDVRARLTAKICQERLERPHTMLDEMLAMLEFSRGPLGENGWNGARSGEDAARIELTDAVAAHFAKTLTPEANRPDLIRSAVHGSFFDLFNASGIESLSEFKKQYMDRARKFFHCRTVLPGECVTAAEAACAQIAASGLFNPERLTLLELHLTNRCNLNCDWCTYRSRDAGQSLRFADLAHVGDLAPLEVLIAGGGEPTLFRDGATAFSDAIAELRERLPGARLRLITNGTVIPPGDWMSKLDQVSVSLDEGSADSYAATKGRDMFRRVWDNIQTYLRDSPVSAVRVTKIYDARNYLDSLALSQNLFSLWNALPAHSAKRAGFRFEAFPMADDANQSSPYEAALLTRAQKTAWLALLEGEKARSPEFYGFIRRQTNLFDLSGPDPAVAPAEKCWPAAHYALLSADRKFYPCFAACAAFGATNFGAVDQTPAELAKRRGALLAQPPLHCAQGCRPGSVFYGARSKSHHLAQREAGLPTVGPAAPSGRPIVHVSCHDPDSLLGGQGWAVYNLCKEQVARGNRVYWISPCVGDQKPGEYLYEDGRLRVVKIEFWPKRVNTMFAHTQEADAVRAAFADSAVREISRWFTPEACVVHLHGFAQTPQRSEVLRRRGYRVISTFHMLLSVRAQASEAAPDGARMADLRALERRAVASNSVITAPSQGMVAELLEVHPGYGGSAVCVPNGIGHEFFSTPAGMGPVLPSRAVAYGRISPEKGFDLVLDAAGLLAGSPGSPSFLIFGGADQSVPARRAYAERLTRQAGMLPNVQLAISATGIVGTERISLIDGAAFGIVPSRYEPFGMVIPEIMARGKPVITTPTAGAREIMETDKLGRNDYGFIVDCDPRAMARAVDWMARHPSEVAEMGERCAARARAFQWSRVAAMFDELYQLLGREETQS